MSTNLAEDYYGHHPTVSIERPVVVSGTVQPEVRAVGQRVAALLGIRYTDLWRAVEHREGGSMQELLERLPAHHLRRAEEQLLAACLDESPPGLITVADLALSKRANLLRVRKDAFFVVLDYGVRDCHRRFRDLYPGAGPNWISEARDASKLRYLYAQWTRRFETADVSISMSGKSWQAAVKSVMEVLDPASTAN